MPVTPWFASYVGSSSTMFIFWARSSFGLSTDREDTFDATVELAGKAGLDFAQFVTLTPFPGTVDFKKWETEIDQAKETIDGIPLNRFWLIPRGKRPKLYLPHPTMTPDEIRARTQKVWNKFYELSTVWKRSRVTNKLRDRLAYVLISMLFPQMYANTGLATDSARSRGSPMGTLAGKTLPSGVYRAADAGAPDTDAEPTSVRLIGRLARPIRCECGSGQVVPHAKQCPGNGCGGIEVNRRQRDR